jgi:hypothetical protein
LSFPILGARFTVAVNTKHTPSSVLDIFADNASFCLIFYDFLELSDHIGYLSRLKWVLENWSMVMWNGLDWHRMWSKGNFHNNSDEALDSTTYELLMNQCLTAQDWCCTIW